MILTVNNSSKRFMRILGKGMLELLVQLLLIYRKKKSKEDVVDDDFSKEISDLFNISRYQLIARLRNLGDISDSDKGPSPQSVKGHALKLLISSDESDSSQEAANSGYLTPATLLGLQGGHNNKRQSFRGKQFII